MSAEKSDLTIDDVLDYLKSNFVKSKAYPNKVIRRDTGTYMLFKQAATMASFELCKDFSFKAVQFDRHLIKAFRDIPTIDREISKQFYKIYPQWAYFDKYFSESTAEKAAQVNAKKAIEDYAYNFIHESKNENVFFDRLTQWVKETGRNLTLKRVNLKRVILVSA